MKFIKISGKKYPNLSTKVDDEDYDNLVSMGKWLITKSGRKNALPYVSRFDFSLGKWIMIHRVIMKAEHGQFIDHINHDTLDNRKKNLRFCTNQQNQYNQRRRAGVKWLRGVTFCPRDSKSKPWKAQIKVMGRNMYLGSFKTEGEAHEIYKKELDQRMQRL